MPFYAVGAGSGQFIRTTKLRYLNITVHSIRCHFASVVIAVSHKLDPSMFLKSQAFLSTTSFSTQTYQSLPAPVSAIRRIQDRLLADPRWANLSTFSTPKRIKFCTYEQPRARFLLMEAAVNDRANLGTLR